MMNGCFNGLWINFQNSFVFQMIFLFMFRKCMQSRKSVRKNELWHRYDTNLKKLKKEAERSLVGEPACEDETNPEFDSIATWMSEGDPELTDASALASVRAGSPSIEVLVLRKKGDDICFLPWQYGESVFRRIIFHRKKKRKKY